MESSPYLDTWKDATLEVYIESVGANGEYQPALGLSGIELTLSVTEQGAAIADLGGAVTERGAGYYYKVLDLADMTAYLPAGMYPNRSYIWVQVRSPGNIEVEGFRKTIRRSKS